MATNNNLNAKVLQDMINERYTAEFKRYETIYNTETPGKSPSDISFDKSNEIYATLAE